MNEENMNDRGFEMNGTLIKENKYEEDVKKMT